MSITRRPVCRGVRASVARVAGPTGPIGTATVPMRAAPGSSKILCPRGGGARA